MLKNHLKVAYRNIFKYRGYSFINIIGLSLGIAAVMFIWQYVTFERSYDQFHSKADRIYRLPIQFYRQNTPEMADAMNYAPTGPTLKQELPEVEEFVRITPEYGRIVLSYERAQFEEAKVFYADSTFFQVFDFPLLEGDKNSCLVNPGSIVLTKSVAERYFGNWEKQEESPLGKTINLNKDYPFTVTGIMADVPENSHIKLNVLLPFTTFIQTNNDPSDNWGWNDFYTYVQLKEGTKKEVFASKLPDFILRHKEIEVEGTYEKFLVQPLKDIHLTSKLGYEAEPNGDAKTVNFLAIIALAILLIAWVNYINLATARAEERSKEVGVRKVIGASKKSLIFQFLTEAFILNTVAIALAIILLPLFAPYMNALIGKDLALNVQNLPLGFGIIPLFIFGGTLLSGLYPAFILSAFKPVDTLKGSEKRHQRGVWLRKGLVVFQYAVSVLLITGTLIIYKQLRFMQNQDLGFSLDQTLVLNAPSVINEDSILTARYESFKNELAQYPAIKEITSSSAIPGKSYYDLDTHGGLFLIGAGKENAATFSTMRVEDNFLEAYGMEMIAGRYFSKEMKTDLDQEALIINETALQLLGLNTPEEAIGKRIHYWNQEKPIVGVIKDYHHKSLRNVVEPMVIRNNMGGHLYFSLAFSAKNKSDIEQLIGNVQKSWSRVYPENPFNYFFLDDQFNEQYTADNQLAKIVGIFSLLAIIIACLGLFGLASYLVTMRTKEIGIRKVLGASISGIVVLLTKDYFGLLIVAFFLGVPGAYYLFDQWLANFAFSMTLSPWLFLIPCLLVLVIAFLAVSSQSIQAALKNPVEALRKE